MHPAQYARQRRAWGGPPGKTRQKMTGKYGCFNQENIVWCLLSSFRSCLIRATSPKAMVRSSLKRSGTNLEHSLGQKLPLSIVATGQYIFLAIKHAKDIWEIHSWFVYFACQNPCICSCFGFSSFSLISWPKCQMDEMELRGWSCLKWYRVYSISFCHHQTSISPHLRFFDFFLKNFTQAICSVPVDEIADESSQPFYNLWSQPSGNRSVYDFRSRALWTVKEWKIKTCEQTKEHKKENRVRISLHWSILAS